MEREQLRNRHVRLLETTGYAGREGRITHFHGEVDSRGDGYFSSPNEMWISFDDVLNVGAWVTLEQVQFIESKE